MLYELFTWVHDKEGILHLDRFIVGHDDLSDAHALAQSRVRQQRADLYGALFRRDTTHQSAHASHLDRLRAFQHWLDALSTEPFDTPHSCFFYYFHYAIAHQPDWLTQDNLTRFFLAWFDYTPLEANEALTSFLSHSSMSIHHEVCQFALIETHRQRISQSFKHESHPLHSVELIKNWIADPPVFIGAILSLLDRELSPETLTQTGLLHDYFRYYLFTLSETDNPLRLLEKALEAQPKGRTLIECLQSVASDERGFDRYSLLGVLSDPDLLHIVPHDYPTLAFDPSPTNFDNLYHLFGTSFLADLFIYNINLTHPEWHTALVNRLNSPTTTADELTEITQLIAKTAVHQLKPLAACLTDNTIKTHFEHAPIAMMYLLEHHPFIAHLVTLCDINRFIAHCCIDKDHGPERIQALYCFFKTLHKRASEHSTAVYEALLEICLMYPPAHEDRELLKTLKRFENKEQVITPLIHKLEDKLTRLIEQQLPTFNQSAYHEIEDAWRDGTTQFNLIDEIISHRRAYPRDKYALLSTIAKHYFQYYRDAHLDDFLHALEIEYDFDDRTFTLYERLLIELLCSIDKRDIEEEIIQRFETHPTRHDSWFFTPYANQPLWQRAIERGNIRLIEWLRPRLEPDLEELRHSTLKAASAHQWPMVSHLLSLSSDLPSSQLKKLLIRATKDDQPAILERYAAPIRERHFNEVLFDIAFKAQSTDCMAWILTTATPAQTHLTKYFNQAIKHQQWWFIKNLRVLDLDSYPVLTKALSNQLSNAAMYGHVVLYQHLKPLGIDCALIHHLMVVSASTDQADFLSTLLSDHHGKIEIVMLKDSIIQAIKQRKASTSLLLLHCIQEKYPSHVEGLIQFIIKKKWIEFFRLATHELDLPPRLLQKLAHFAISNHQPELLNTLLPGLLQFHLVKLFKLAVNQQQIMCCRVLLPYIADVQPLINECLRLTHHHKHRLVNEYLSEVQRSLTPEPPRPSQVGFFTRPKEEAAELPRAPSPV